MLSLIVIFFLLVVVFQDIKDRKIYWFLPLLVFIASIIIDILQDGNLNYQTIIGSIFVIAFLWIYVYIRFKSTKLFTDYFGLGDALILIAIAPLFELQTYFWFIAIASVFSLAMFIITRIFKPIKTIPFAGYISVLIIGLMTLDLLQIQLKLLPIQC
jgi:prepilin signal peptidase PulO-like enzyme (type II secretory pathway)